MPLLINGVSQEDKWAFVNTEDFAENSQSYLERLNQQGAPVVFPIASFLEHQAKISLDANCVGLLVTGDDDLSAIDELLAHVSLIAIEFPVLRDGRGFSIARNVTRRGFAGEVRAVGDVGYDRLDYMQRSGFNAYQIPDAQYNADTIKAFSEISVNYQPTHLR